MSTSLSCSTLLTCIFPLGTGRERAQDAFARVARFIRLRAHRASTHGWLGSYTLTLPLQTFANDKESQREKFVLIIWIGSSVKVMRKAKVRPRVATFLSDTIELTLNELVERPRG